MLEAHVYHAALILIVEPIAVQRLNEAKTNADSPLLGPTAF